MLLKNVLKGYLQKYDIEELTIFENGVPVFSGSPEEFLVKKGNTMYEERIRLGNMEMRDQHVFNFTKLFLFVGDTEKLFSWKAKTDKRCVGNGYVLAKDRTEAEKKIDYLHADGLFANSSGITFELDDDDCGYNGCVFDKQGICIMQSV